MKKDNKGRFAKGNTGKPKGAISQKTKMWEALGKYVVEEGSERAMQYLATLEDKDFFNSYILMLEYFKPKQSRVESSHDGSIDIKVTREIIDNGDTN